MNKLTIRNKLKETLRSMLSLLPEPATPVDAGPKLHLRWRLGWIRGWAVRPVWRVKQLLGGPRIVIGKRFALHGSLVAHGPGTILIGDDVLIHSTVTPFTHSPDAVIRIGDRTQMSGTRLGCAEKIEIGRGCIVADARLMDTDFHATSRRRTQTPGLPVATKRVCIQDNVWIGAGAAILKGVTVGENSIVAFGAVVLRSVPPDTITAGNPARVIAPVPD